MAITKLPLVRLAQGRVYALDNRPHMGFPLDRGSVEDGILTCHWHHATVTIQQAEADVAAA